MNDRPERAPAPETSRAEIELSQLDLRYEGHRLRQRGVEDRLLASIAREGIREPLAGALVESTAPDIRMLENVRFSLQAASRMA
jgi:hypothetical protein